MQGIVQGVLSAMAGTGEQAQRQQEQGRGRGQYEGGARVPLDAAAVDELCIWLLSNMSGIAMVRSFVRLSSRLPLFRWHAAGVAGSNE